MVDRGVVLGVALCCHSLRWLRTIRCEREVQSDYAIAGISD